MKTFDFLPQRYRDQSAARQGQWWRLGVVLLLGGVLAATAAIQQTWKSAAARELARVELEHAQVEELRQQLSQCESAAQDVQSQADLLAYVRHPWPRSQVLSAVTRNLSPPIRLTRLSMMHDGKELGSAGRPGAAGSPPPAAPPTDPAAAAAKTAAMRPAERDLKTLRDLCDSRRLVVEVIGQTDDLPALHEYLGRLSGERLIEKADLVSVEQEGKSNEAAAQFRLRLLLRNGYGQPGGPSLDTAAGEGPPGHAKQG